MLALARTRFNSTKKSESGQTLLEIMISLTVMTIALVAIVSRATDAVRNANFSRNKILAARFAQEGVEWVRQQRDRMGWTQMETFIITHGNPITYCVLDLGVALSSLTTSGPCASGSYISGTIFNREVRFTHTVDAAGNYITVMVTVNWTDSIGIHNSQYSTVLSRWRN